MVLRTPSWRRSATSTSASTSPPSSGTCCPPGRASTSRRTPTGSPRRQRRLGRGQPGSRRHPRRLQDDRRCSPPATAPQASVRRAPRHRGRHRGRRVDPVRRRPAGTRSCGHSQINDNDVMVWSNRGFGANATNGVDVVADGAYAPGDVDAEHGARRPERLGHLGRHQPVHPGRGRCDRTGLPGLREAPTAPVPGGFYKTAKDILKSSAKDLGYDANVQGSGSVDAGQGGGQRGRAAGDACRRRSGGVGDYRGTEYPVFAQRHLARCGPTPRSSPPRPRRLAGQRPAARPDRQRRRSHFNSKDLSKESTANFNAPDYLIDLTKLVKQHRNADLMVVKPSIRAPSSTVTTT